MADPDHRQPMPVKDIYGVFEWLIVITIFALMLSWALHKFALEDSVSSNAPEHPSKCEAVTENIEVANVQG